MDICCAWCPALGPLPYVQGIPFGMGLIRIQSHLLLKKKYFTGLSLSSLLWALDTSCHWTPMVTNVHISHNCRWVPSKISNSDVQVVIALRPLSWYMCPRGENCGQWWAPLPLHIWSMMRCWVCFSTAQPSDCCFQPPGNPVTYWDSFNKLVFCLNKPQSTSIDGKLKTLLNDTQNDTLGFILILWAASCEVGTILVTFFGRDQKSLYGRASISLSFFVNGREEFWFSLFFVCWLEFCRGFFSVCFFQNSCFSFVLSRCAVRLWITADIVHLTSSGSCKKRPFLSSCIESLKFPKRNSPFGYSSKSCLLTLSWERN